MTQRVTLGKWGEATAEKYLREKGLIIIGRNVKLSIGELDLVAKEANEIVFIEVKTMREGIFGNPEQHVDNHKKQKLRRLAELFMRQHKLNTPYRIDVVAITTIPNSKPNIHYIKDAVQG